MITFPHEPHEIRYPIGVDMGNGNKQIAIRFPEKLFDQIIDMARKEKKNFNDMVVSLVSCGKLCLDESDALEPPND